MYSTNFTRMFDSVFALPNYSTLWYLNTSRASSEQTKHDKDGTANITVFVPGLAKEDFSLQVLENGTLELCTKEHVKDKIVRNWQLSEKADFKNIKAECKNGLFKITVPVKAKLDKTRSIEIT